MSKHLLLILISLIFFLLSFSQAGLVRVPQDQPSIQEGINSAVNGDTVLVADSTYYENINFMGKAITVASNFLMDDDSVHIDSTIINGSQPSNPNAASVVTFESGEDSTSILCGFTITAGTGKWYSSYAAQVGGGIYCYNSGCKIIANKIINNSVTGPSAYGGGLAAMPIGSSAWVVLKDNQIMDNTITANAGDAWGGGVALWSNGMVVNNTISSNSVIHNATDYQAGSGGVDCASDPLDRRTVIIDSNRITYNSVVSNSTASPSALGGGIMIDGCQGRFTKNELSYNQLSVNSDRNASGAGMGVLRVPDAFIIEGNIIDENAVTQGTGWGGGLNIYNASPTLFNNIIDGNSATNGGGILIGGNSTAKLVNNNIINNQATYGGGIFLGYENPTNYLMNTIIWGNQAPTNAAIHIESGTIQVAYSDVQGGWTGTGNMNLNPEIVTDSLTNTSPCIGTGIDVYDFGGGTICFCPPDDINGRMRPYPNGSHPDMGAWESKLGPVGIEPQPVAGVSKSYKLYQNYPNPFNPTTVISWQLAVNSPVNLRLNDLNGQLVKILVNERQAAGIHSIEFDGTGLASGVYFYRLQAGDSSPSSHQSYVQTKKMLLIR